MKTSKSLLDKIIWGDVDEMEVPKVWFQLDQAFWKESYRLDEQHAPTLIEDIVKRAGIEGDIEVKTGKGGKKLLKSIKSEYANKAILEKGFDPLEADHFVNPILPTGHRLSSYMFLIIVGRDKSIKFVPKNPVKQ